MKANLRRVALAIAMLLTVICQSQAAYVKVEASMDSTKILMGRMAALKVTVTRQAGAPGVFPQFKECPEDGYVSFLGDSVEMRRPRLVDSVMKADREMLSYEIPVQVFDSGAYRLPEILYVSGGDTARSLSLPLAVYPLSVTANDSIAPYSTVLEADGFSVFDWVPDWLYNFWWLILLLALVVVCCIWLWRRYRTQGSILPPKPLPTPFKQAMSRLETLRGRKLWEKGMEKEYFTELTDILRVYLFRRFGINAMEMTSRQIMEHLSDNPDVKDKRSYMRNILNMADFVKFAKVRPLPADNVAAYDDAVKFVEETRPSAEQEKEMLEKEMAALAASAASPQPASSGSKSGKKKKIKTSSSKKKKSKKSGR